MRRVQHREVFPTTVWEYANLAHRLGLIKQFFRDWRMFGWSVARVNFVIGLVIHYYPHVRCRTHIEQRRVNDAVAVLLKLRGNIRSLKTHVIADEMLGDAIETLLIYCTSEDGVVQSQSRA